MKAPGTGANSYSILKKRIDTKAKVASRTGVNESHGRAVKRTKLSWEA